MFLSEARKAPPAAIHKELNPVFRPFNIARTAWGMESLTNPVNLIKAQRPRLPPGRDRRLQRRTRNHRMAAL